MAMAMSVTSFSYVLLRLKNDFHTRVTAPDMKQAITPEVKAQCEALGKAMAEKLLAE